MNTVKVIAETRIHKTEAGGELEVTPAVARALVALGKVRYAESQPEAPKPERAPRRARAAPAGGSIGVMTRGPTE